jgi:hypothetical protein
VGTNEGIWMSNLFGGVPQALFQRYMQNMNILFGGAVKKMLLQRKLKWLQSLKNEKYNLVHVK